MDINIKNRLLVGAIVIISCASIFSGVFTVKYTRYKFIKLAEKINTLETEISRVAFLKDIASKNKTTLEKQIQSVRDDILTAMLAEKVEKLCKGAKTDQEKCLYIARWIAENIPNRTSYKKPNALGWFAYRYGVCGERSQLFVKMLEFEHIPARVFLIHNFGRVGGGHCCAQAYYGRQWHFFDPTYAGVFIKDGKVLSWNEIKNNPKEALKNMLIFKQTHDRSGSQDDPILTRTKTDNIKRMHSIYTVEAIKKARSYGFWKSDKPKHLYSKVDLSKAPIVLGKLDKNYKDVSASGVEHNISERLGLSLGNTTYTFYTTWEFENCIPGKTYTIIYSLYKATAPGLKYWVKTKNAELISGNNFISTQELVKGQPALWEIKFKPEKKTCSLTIGYNFRKPEGLLFPDKIEIK